MVIGIIALLISILLPSLNRARESAKRVNCLANQRSIGQELVFYLNANKTRFPISYFEGGHKQVDFGLESSYTNWDFMKNIGTPGFSFFGALIAQNDGLSPALVCPSSERAGDGWPEGQPITNYLINANFINRKATQVPGSSEYIVLQDNKASSIWSYLRPIRAVAVGPKPYAAPYANAFTGPFTAGDRWSYWAWTPAGAGYEDAYANVHNGGGSFLMADGHGEWKNRNDVIARNFGLTSGPGVTGKPDTTYKEDNKSTLTYRSIFDTTRQ